MCDECNVVYYIYCLNLFLDKVLEEEYWYCFFCKIDFSEVVKVGERFKMSKKKVKMLLVSIESWRDWGRGMVCVGCMRECIIVFFNYYGFIFGIFVGLIWRFRV